MEILIVAALVVYFIFLNLALEKEVKQQSKYRQENAELAARLLRREDELKAAYESVSDLSM